MMNTYIIRRTRSWRAVGEFYFSDASILKSVKYQCVIRIGKYLTYPD